MKTRAIFLVTATAIVLTDTSNAQVGVLKERWTELSIEIDSAIIKSEQDKAKREQRLIRIRLTAPGQRIPVLKQLVAGFRQKLTISSMTSNKFTGRIYTQMKHTIKKRWIKQFYTYFTAYNEWGIEVKPVNYKEGDKTQPMVILFDNDTGLWDDFSKEGPKTVLYRVFLRFSYGCPGKTRKELLLKVPQLQKQEIPGL